MDYWVPIMCPDGPYELNIEGVTRLIRANAYAEGVLAYTAPDYEPTSSGDDGGYYMNLMTDWPSVYRQRDMTLRVIGTDFYDRMSAKDMTGKAGIEYLEGLADDRDAYIDTVKQKQKEYSRVLIANLTANIAAERENLAAATFLRNAAAETELVLVGWVTAPATIAAALLAGSVGKGLIKWQDTDSVLQGFGEGAIELLMNTVMLPIKAGITGTTKKVLIGLLFGWVKGSLKGMAGLTTYLDPKEFKNEAVVAGLANMPPAVASDLAKLFFSDPRLAIPAAVVLKLALKAEGASMAKAVNQSQSGGQPQRSPVLLNKSPVVVEWTTIGRQAIHNTLSTCLLDCGTPSKDYVTKYALRPLRSM